MEPTTTPEGTKPAEQSEADRAAEAAVARNRARRGDGDGPADEAAEPRSGAELIRAAADGKELTNEERVDALDWFMGDDESAFTHAIEVNVGTPKKAKWLTWEIRPVDLDTLKRIREKSQGGTRQQRRRSQATGEIDEVEANIRIVIEGTVAPDLTEIAHSKRLTDPGDVLRRKFAHKPGLLGQIAGEIMSISGYDDEDIREVDAAGNS